MVYREYVYVLFCALTLYYTTYTSLHSLTHTSLHYHTSLHHTTPLHYLTHFTTLPHIHSEHSFKVITADPSVLVDAELAEERKNLEQPPFLVTMEPQQGVLRANEGM
jgi:hypothetical protein